MKLEEKLHLYENMKLEEKMHLYECNDALYAAQT